MKKNDYILILCVVVLSCSFFIVPVVLADNAVLSATVGNSLPEANGATLNFGDDIILTSNATTDINGEVTISDSDGCLTLDNVTGIMYRSSVGENATDNKRNHYTVLCSSDGDCDNATDPDESYVCEFHIYWYADPTDMGSDYEVDSWVFVATPADSYGFGTSDQSSQEIYSLTALSLITKSLSFGSLSLGTDTGSTNENITIQNQGNEPIDINMKAYGTTDGDDLAMNCDDTGSISVGYLEYALSSFTYGGGSSMASTFTEADLDLDRGSESVERPSDLVFFGFGVPSSGVKGSCTGTLVISAVSDPGLD